jgi:hypothetical protein
MEQEIWVTVDTLESNLKLAYFAFIEESLLCAPLSQPWKISVFWPCLNVHWIVPATSRSRNSTRSVYSRTHKRNHHLRRHFKGTNQNSKNNILRINITNTQTNPHWWTQWRPDQLKRFWHQNVICRVVRVTKRRVLVRMIGSISTSVTHSLWITLKYRKYNAIADLHNLQFTVPHALGFSVSTSLLLATDLNAETITSNHY